MEDLINQLMVYAQSHGLSVAVAFALGLFGKPAIKLLRPFVTRTPSKLDDLLLNGVEACLRDKEADFSHPALSALVEHLSSVQVMDLARILKARLVAEREASVKAQAAKVTS